MNYEIINEPKHKNLFQVIIEGENEDGQFFTWEQLFSKEEFETKVSEDLVKILDGYYNNMDSILHELSNDTFEFSCSDLGDCEDMSGYEVIYFDENGVAYPVVMNY